MSSNSGIFGCEKEKQWKSDVLPDNCQQGSTNVNRDQSRLTLATVPVHQLNNHQKLSVNLKRSSHHSKKIRANFDEDEFNFRDFLMRKRKAI